MSSPAKKLKHRRALFGARPRREAFRKAKTYLAKIALLLHDAPDQMLMFPQLIERFEALTSGDQKRLKSRIRLCLSTNKCFVQIPGTPDPKQSRSTSWKLDCSLITAKMVRHHFTGLLQSFPELASKAGLCSATTSEASGASSPGSPCTPPSRRASPLLPASPLSASTTTSETCSSTDSDTSWSGGSGDEVDVDAFLLEMQRKSKAFRAEHERLLANIQQGEVQAREAWEQWEAMSGRQQLAQDEDYRNIMAKLVEAISGQLNPID